MPVPPAQQSSAPDARWHRIDQAMQRLDYKPAALIETLHVAQESFGFLDADTLTYIAAKLHLPPAKVFGVVTFYNHFQLQPPGKHTLAVCTGTACHLKGNDQLLPWLREQYNLVPGQTTTDQQLSLVEVRCVGACALAPVFLTDQVLVGKQQFTEATRLIREWLDHGS